MSDELLDACRRSEGVASSSTATAQSVPSHRPSARPGVQQGNIAWPSIAIFNIFCVHNGEAEATLRTFCAWAGKRAPGFLFGVLAGSS
jgi:hypothetical protein